MRYAPALAVALASTACVRSDRAARTDQAPAILLVTLDSTRADHLGPYGYPRASSPNLDALAASGTVWLRAYAASPQTLPSHATVLTGLYPPTHGVRDGGDYRLPRDTITLAERLSDAGWRTLAFTAALSTHRSWGLDQGFDVYHDPLGALPGDMDWPTQRHADEVVDDVMATLSAGDPDRPTFVWVHLYDPHWPYGAPDPWRRDIEDPYDAELAFVDHELGRLVTFWDERWGPGRSWVVVTADHGEGLGDGGEQTHGQLLHDATIHVPLVIRGPGITAGGRDEAVVSHVDIVPTLLDLAGLDPHEGLQGRDLRRGGSGFAYSETQLGQVAFGLAPLAAFTDEDGRITRGAWSAWYPSLGPWVSMDGERLDPSDGRLTRLTALEASLEHRVPVQTSLDAQTLEMIAALGYLASGDADQPPGAIDPRDVTDALPLAFRVRERMGTGLLYQARELLSELELRLPDTYGVQALNAQLLHRQGRLEEARAAWEAVYLHHPTPTVALQIAGLDSATGDWFGAEGWYDAVLHDQPDSPEALAGRARTAWMLGDDVAADALVSELMVVHPEHPETALVRAEQLLHEGELDAAMAEARAGAEALPWSPWGLHVIGGVLWARGRPDAAVEALQQAVALDPYAAAVRLRLADFLLEMGRHPEAVRTLAPLARVAPDDEAIQGVYKAARTAMTIDDRYRLRVERARGPTNSGR